jgi:branched-chain amino acid transport system permease protein
VWVHGSIILQQLVNALAIGSLYALIALGYTMVYGVLRLINFAHGDVFMLGAFAGAYVGKAVNLALGHSEYAAQPWWSFLLGLVTAVIVCGVIGYLIERLAYRPLRHSSRLSALITAIGVSLLIEYLASMEWHIGSRVYFGPSPINFPKISLFTDAQGNAATVRFLAHWLHVDVAWTDVLLLSATALVLVLLMLLVRYTRMGKAMRAVSLSYTSAQLMGINLNSVISFTFVLGSALAAVGAVLYGVKYNQVMPLMGLAIGLKAFVAAVIGGIGNIPGAAAGGLLLGLAETTVGALGYSRYQDAIAFVILIIVLLVKPEGLFGQAVQEKV